MRIFKMVILAGLFGFFTAGMAFAQSPRGDEAILAMSDASKRGDSPRLRSLLAQVGGHPLEPWGVYWEIKARLNEASSSDVQSALSRLNGTYLEDRLRNDWLLILGQRRDWSSFSVEYPKFRMNDDREVRCYALHVEHLRGNNQIDAIAQEVLRNWHGLRDADDGCTLAAAALFDSKQIRALDVWKKARLSIEAKRPRAAASAVSIVSPASVVAVNEINANPVRYLNAIATATGATHKELITLALIRLAVSDVDAAATALENKWSAHLSAEERSWAWATIGKQSNLKLASEAADYFAKTRNDHLNDDLLGWKARAALRSTTAAQGWTVVRDAIDAMSDTVKREPVWAYWKARALREHAKGKPAMITVSTLGVSPTLVLRHELQEAQDLLQSIASPRGFYEILAAEELGQKLTLPAPPSPLTANEKDAARLHPGLNRALYAIAIGLRA